MRVLITGSRSWTKPLLILAELERVQGARPASEMTLVSGACPKGADNMAEAAARTLGWNVETHPANWTKYGQAAGHRRNQQMVDLGADVCLAFVGPCVKKGCQQEPKPHDSHGTTGCAQMADRAGIPTHTHRLPL